MADISWTEGTGSSAMAMSLGSLRPDPGNRLFDVNPDYVHIGNIRTTLAQVERAFTFGDYYTLAFTIKHLLPSQHEAALLLKRHLTKGGTVTLTTDDVDGNTYS